MPRRSLTTEQLQRFWDTFPYGDIGRRLAAFHRFGREVGPLAEELKRAAVYRPSPGDKARLGVSRMFTAPTDIGKDAAFKAAGAAAGR